MPPRPKSAQHYLQLRQLFDKLAKKAGVPHAQFRGLTGVGQQTPFGTSTSGGGEGDYSPQAVADVGHNTLLWNYAPTKFGLPEQQQDQYDRFVVGHELGHLSAEKHVNPHLAQEYLAMTHQSGTRPDPRTGLPMQGPGTQHTSPYEQYANDVAASIGQRYGSGGLSGARSNRVLKQLSSAGVIPGGKRKKRK